MKKIFLYLFIMVLMSMAIFFAACDRPAGQPQITPPEQDLPEAPPEDPHGADNGISGDLFAEAREVENRYTVEDAFPGITFEQPLDLQTASDGSGRIFVVEQGGRIYVIPGPKSTEKELFLDIREMVDDGSSEMGLLGLAFHPDFAENGYIFVNYTNTSGTVVARFTASENQADQDSRMIILTFTQPFRNHNGGQLAFGTDGYLYISTGDGGSGGDPQGHGQNRQTFHGNILRIDINEQGPRGNYVIPPDNPFVGNDEGYLEEIYAYGLRNPWRFSFDSADRLWAADVGQSTVEEINIIEKGKNYGWNIMEGSLCFNPPADCDLTGLELPVYEYLHPLGRSITGGYVYDGSELPQLKGAYIYADYITGLIWGLWYHEEYEPVNYTLTNTDLNITSFGLDEDNELYMTAFDGIIYRLKLE